ncbi:PAS domain-containing protein [Methylomonas sp. MED-D]|uniref:PAS sensor protein n=1 Tax=Methylomonas koyamae TaxID=702114 RepID=A0A177NBY4_9GAMM|nr:MULTISPECIES: PAS domain-containing protein [Methylomonas]NJA04873.1 PAS domain-containing protein [Methylococcaceae bacterium WWC4]MDT4329018.1 PAS domain-containing protein [Methylomonas sp. MV1]OAI14953.1 PAS sensor protein [Methylomonas koyamae]OHX35283.1 PAS sensor protein [Methylomonas sp. LWB]WGS87769.1 PAS domain-containing protein [Methylomonas sp. UP202]
MPFVVKKDSGIIPQILSAILDECVNGVTLADPDLDDAPIVYANKAFERLTGYGSDEIVGHNCRFLQGEDRDQPARRQIAEAMRKHESVEVELRNYKKDGTLFHNRLRIIPLFDNKQRVMYYLGVQYDITQQVNADHEIQALSALLGSTPGQTG